MADEIFNKYKRGTKAIAIAVALLFTMQTITWAYPDTVKSMSDTLSVQSVFQPVMMSSNAELFKDSIFSEADTLTTTLSIGQYLLGDPDRKTPRLPLEYLESVVGNALSSAGIRSGNIDIGRTYFHPKSSKIVLIPYNFQEKRCVIQIACKQDVPRSDLSGYEWIISDKYAVKVLPETEVPGVRKKVLLISSPLISFNIGQKEKKSGYFTKPPLGFYKLKKDLTAKGLAYVDVFDPNLHPENASELLAERIRTEGYDVVSIGLMHENAKDVVEWIDNIKAIAEESGQRIPIVLGGSQEGTHNYKKWFKFSAIDGVVLGYGELTLEHILYNLGRGKPAFSMVPGIAYEGDDGKIKVQPAEDFDTEDFRELTFTNDPAEQIPYRDYWKHNGSLFSPENYRARGATLETIEFFTSSHCRNHCGFCSRCTALDAAAGTANRPVLFLSAEEMLALLVKYINYHDPRAVFMREDDLINDRGEGRTRAIKFFHMVRQAREEGMIPFDFKIYLQTKTKTLVTRDESGQYSPDVELLTAMSESGVYLTATGFESFSDYLLNAPSINKKTNSEINITAVKGLREAGMIPLINIQLFPPEIRVADFLKNAEGVIKHVKAGGQISVLPTLDYLPGAAIARKADSGEYETIGYDLTDKRTGEKIYHPVSFVPTNHIMKKAFLEQEEKQSEIEEELLRNPKYNRFAYMPQPVTGLIRIAAVYRSLNMEGKVQEIYSLIFDLLGKAEHSYDEWNYPDSIASPEIIHEQERKARFLMANKEISLSKASDLCVIMENISAGNIEVRGEIVTYLHKFLLSAPDTDENIIIKDRIRSAFSRNKVLAAAGEAKPGYKISDNIGIMDTGKDTALKESEYVVTGKFGVKRIFSLLSMLFLMLPGNLLADEAEPLAPWIGPDALSSFEIFSAAFIVIALILGGVEAFDSLKEIFKKENTDIRDQEAIGKKDKRGGATIGAIAGVAAITPLAVLIYLFSIASDTWVNIFPLYGVSALSVLLIYLAGKNVLEQFIVFNILDKFKESHFKALHSHSPHTVLEPLINEVAILEIPWKYKYPVMKKLAFDALSPEDPLVVERIEKKIEIYKDPTGFMSMALADVRGSPAALKGLNIIVHNFDLTQEQRIEALKYMGLIKQRGADVILLDVLKNDPYYKVREAAYKLVMERDRKWTRYYEEPEFAQGIHALRPTLSETIKSTFLEMFPGWYLKHKLYIVTWLAFLSEAVLWHSSNMPLSIVAAGTIAMVAAPIIVAGASCFKGHMAYAFRSKNIDNSVVPGEDAPLIISPKAEIPEIIAAKEKLPASGIKVSEEDLQLFEIFEKEANSRRRRCIEAANRLNAAYYKYAKIGILPTVILNKMPTVEVKTRIDLIVSNIEKTPELLNAFPEKEKGLLKKLKSERSRIEVDAMIASIISMAVTASYTGKDFVLAIETDWIEGYLQKEAIDILINEIGGLEKAMKKAGLKNLKVLLKNGEESMDSWSARVKKASGSETDLSNILFFGGTRSITYFNEVEMKNFSSDKRAFLAGVDPVELISAYKEYGEDFDKQLNVKFIEMLAVSLEIAAGKVNPKYIQTSGITVKFDPENRILWMIPSAAPVEYDRLKNDYKLKLLALRAA